MGSAMNGGGGQGRPFPQSLSLGCHSFWLVGWQASPLLMVTHSKHFDNCHSHRLCESAPAVANMKKKRIACARLRTRLPTLFILPAPHPSSAFCLGLKWDTSGVQERDTPSFPHPATLCASLSDGVGFAIPSRLDCPPQITLFPPSTQPSASTAPNKLCPVERPQ